MQQATLTTWTTYLQLQYCSIQNRYRRTLYNKLKILCVVNTKLVINVFIQNGAVLIFHNKSHTEKRIRSQEPTKTHKRFYNFFTTIFLN